jgi:YgiT-type zinc finger domain-containing protein
MADAIAKRAMKMKCSISGCSGEYELKRIVHTVRHRNEIVVIDDVPAEVCSICGDTLLAPETARHIEAILSTRQNPAKTAPVYHYA